MATTDELKNEVLAYQFSSQRYATRIISWLDEAHKKIWREVDLIEEEATQTITTTSGDSAYNITTPFAQIFNVTLQEGDEPLYRLQYDTIAEYQEESGEPLYYAITNVGGGNDRQIHLAPVPNGEYLVDIFYAGRPETLAIGDNTVNPQIPEDYDYLLVHYAVSRCFASEHDYPAAQFHKGEWDEGLAKMKGEIHYQRRDNVRLVPGDPDLL